MTEPPRFGLHMIKMNRNIAKNIMASRKKYIVVGKHRSLALDHTPQRRIGLFPIGNRQSEIENSISYFVNVLRTPVTDPQPPWSPALRSQPERRK